MFQRKTVNINKYKVFSSDKTFTKQICASVSTEGSLKFNNGTTKQFVHIELHLFFCIMNGRVISLDLCNKHVT